MEKFTLGIVMGAALGALAVANSYKVRMLVKKGQDEAKKRIEEMIDEKLEQMDCENGNCCSDKEEPTQKRRAKKAD